jgi:hypothetical protein
VEVVEIVLMGAPVPAVGSGVVEAVVCVGNPMVVSGKAVELVGDVDDVCICVEVVSVDELLSLGFVEGLD